MMGCGCRWGCLVIGGCAFSVASQNGAVRNVSLYSQLRFSEKK